MGSQKGLTTVPEECSAACLSAKAFAKRAALTQPAEEAPLITCVASSSAWNRNIAYVHGHPYAQTRRHAQTLNHARTLS